jgi:hypothetical protein
MWNLLPHGQESGQGLIQHLWHSNQFSLNLSSMAAMRRFSVLDPLYSERKNLENVGRRMVR